MSGVIITPVRREPIINKVPRFESRGSRLGLSQMSVDGRKSSLRSWSGENAPEASDMVAYLESEDDEEAENIELLPKEEDVPFVSPPTNFVKIVYGASQTLLLNSNCRRKIFMNFLTRKIGAHNRVSAGATLDLCSVEGIFLGIESLDINDNIDSLFQHGSIYLPCVLDKTDAGIVKSITPCLKHWERLYPSLQDIFKKHIHKEQEDAKKKEKAATFAAVAAEKDKEKEAALDKRKKGKLST